MLEDFSWSPLGLTCSILGIINSSIRKCNLHTGSERYFNNIPVVSWSLRLTLSAGGATVAHGAFTDVRVADGLTHASVLTRVVCDTDVQLDFTVGA